MPLNAYSTSKQPSQQVLAQAADWFALLRSGDANQQDKKNWQLWLAANNEHHHAWAFVESVEQSFAAASADNPAEAEQVLLLSRQRRISRRGVLASFTAIFISSGLGFASWRYLPLPRLVNQWRADYKSELGEIKSLQLSDGTKVWLNTASAFNVEITTQQRVITLLQGEILIETAKNDARPLLVNTLQGQIRPIGTKFSVYQQEENTQVDVFQGAVVITLPDLLTDQLTNKLPNKLPNKYTKQIDAGQQITFSKTSFTNVNTADSAKEAWSQGILLAEDISLQDLVKQLSRYQYTYINLADNVAHLSVYGSYPLKSPEQILAMLAKVLPIKVTYISPWWVNIEASDN